MTYTHTYVILEVSEAAYEEIAQKLRKEPDYEQAFHKDSEHGVVIDMHGIALAKDKNRPIPGATLKDIERRAIELAMLRCNGSIATAARQLGIGRATMYRRLNEFGLR